MTTANMSFGWRRRRLFFARHWAVWTTALAVAAFVTLGALTYLVFNRAVKQGQILSPPLTALLLIGNLVAAMVLIVLWGRRLAHRRAAASPIGGNGRLHVRLVAIFSIVSAVPMLLMVVSASLLFQYGVDFWFSDRAAAMFANASNLAQGYYQEKRQSIVNQSVTMAADLRDYLRERSPDDPGFSQGYAYQVYYRELSESAIIQIKPDGGAQTIAMVNPDARPVERRISPTIVRRLETEPVVVDTHGDRIEAVMKLDPSEHLYLYNSRVADPQAAMQTQRAAAVVADYEVLSRQARSIQIYFNLGLYLVSLLIVSVAMGIALTVADRLVRPVAELVGAARRVAAGDLSVQVPVPPTADELGTLSRVFNRMTRRLAEQTETLDARRALIEAVLAGVSAGVLSIDRRRHIQLANASAETLLPQWSGRLIGAPIDAVVPEFAQLLDQGVPSAIVEIAHGGDARTFVVRLVSDQDAHIVTFDDISAQLADQRRAAWSDVARRVAHEIKNPLTPIQLAAERIQRRYGREITSNPEVFQQLTETIVRQVGDLRRMVDEFSSFARTPTPVFAAEKLDEIVRQSVFLHEVAHPAVKFRVEIGEDPIDFICDRRQISQVMTNLIKNAVESIERKPRRRLGQDFVSVCVKREGMTHICVEVADNGEGLPAERDRIAEPYMTKSRKGTGLGLAIVKKIIEDHHGELSFSDRAGGGAVFIMDFDQSRVQPGMFADGPQGGHDDEQFGGHGPDIPRVSDLADDARSFQNENFQNESGVTS